MTATAAATALAPTRARMLRDAANQAARILADARREADGITSQARQEAEQTVSLARAAGRAQAVRQAAEARRQARSDARSALLSAQCEAYDELRVRVRAAVDGLRSEPGYERLLEALTRMAQLEAGPGATISASEEAASWPVLLACSLIARCRGSPTWPSRRCTWRCGSCGHRDCCGASGSGERAARRGGGASWGGNVDVVELGERKLPGEVVAICGDVTTVQAYSTPGA